jgi:hypothetical protein
MTARSRYHSKSTHSPKHFSQLKPEQIAQQLTLIDFETYAEIKVNNCRTSISQHLHSHPHFFVSLTYAHTHTDIHNITRPNTLQHHITPHHNT